MSTSINSVELVALTLRGFEAKSYTTSVPDNVPNISGEKVHEVMMNLHKGKYLIGAELEGIRMRPEDIRMALLHNLCTCKNTFELTVDRVRQVGEHNEAMANQLFTVFSEFKQTKNSVLYVENDTGYHYAFFNWSMPPYNILLRSSFTFDPTIMEDGHPKCYNLNTKDPASYVIRNFNIKVVDMSAYA